MVCRTCDGSMSIDEDEDGLHLKCTMCARSRAIMSSQQSRLRLPPGPPALRNPYPGTFRYVLHGKRRTWPERDCNMQSFKNVGLILFRQLSPAGAARRPTSGVHWKLEGWPNSWRVSDTSVRHRRDLRGPTGRDKAGIRIRVNDPPSHDRDHPELIIPVYTAQRHLPSSGPEG